MTFFTESMRKFEFKQVYLHLTWKSILLDCITVNIDIAPESEFGGVGGSLILFIRFGSTQK